jgi:hypothetical protein
MNDPKENRISYPESTVQKIVNYLAQKPYAEVFMLMQEIRSMGIKIEAQVEQPSTMLDQLS